LLKGHKKAKKSKYNLGLFIIREHGRDKNNAIHAIQGIGNYDRGFISNCEININIPLRNIRTIFDTFMRYGKYPSKWQ
jgi:hypothetical protein